METGFPEIALARPRVSPVLPLYNLPMRVVHTADWHLGQRLPDCDREAEQVRFLDWLARRLLDLDADALLVAGDVFHAGGRHEAAFRLLSAFIERVFAASAHLQLVLIAGNHDTEAQFARLRAAIPRARLHLVASIARQANRLAGGKNLFFLRDRNDQAGALCAAIPYLQPRDYAEFPDGPHAIFRALLAAAEVKRAGLPLIVVAHQRMQDEAAAGGATREYDPPISPTVFSSCVSYVALGHHHKARAIRGQTVIRYAGPPFQVWPAEMDSRPSLTVVELDESGKVETRMLETSLA